VNAKAKINVPFGTSLTRMAKLPSGSSVDVSDRYAEKSALLPKILMAAFFVWWIHSYLYNEGWLYRWTNTRYGKPTTEQIEREKKAREDAVKQQQDAEKSNVAAKANASPSTNAATQPAPEATPRPAGPTAEPAR
jgi:hypothetical protein